MPYAYCRKLDPATGDVVFDRTRSSWSQGHPATEVALRALRTLKGTAARDPNEGIDLADVDLGSPNAQAVVERRINDALAKYVRVGLFSIVDLKVDVVGDAAIWHLVIRDPREGLLPPLEGTL